MTTTIRKDRKITPVRTDIGEGSWIDYYQDAWNLQPAWWDELMALRPVGKRGVLFNNPVPRDLQTYGHSYKFSGKNHDALPIPPILQKFIDRATLITGVHFNMALVNWYMDENDSISPHSDDEKEIALDSDGNTWPVACFSFGQERKFVMKSKQKGSRSVSFSLAPNSLVVMGGACQKTHKHSIPKSKVHCGVRISVTMRVFKE